MNRRLSVVPPPSPAADDSLLQTADGEMLEHARIAAFLQRVRRWRGMCFGQDAEIFRDLGWDVLLDLYLARAEGRDVTMEAIQAAVAGPRAAAARTVTELSRRGYIDHLPVPHSRERHLSLSGKGQDVMNTLLSRLVDQIDPRDTMSVQSA